MNQDKEVFILITQCLEDVESKFGLKDFFDKLNNDDDWTTIIKVHALFESLCSELLTSALKRTELEDCFARMSMGGQNGKIAFLTSLNLLPKQNAQYMKCLSSIRNKLVHNIANVNFSLERYIANLAPNDAKSLISELVPENELSRKGHEYWIRNPMQGLLFGASHFIAALFRARKSL